MGNTFSRHRRRSGGGSDILGSDKLSKESNNKKSREEAEVFITGDNSHTIDRKPLDKSDPWGHMAAVVHGKHGG
jgi:hypothetical protein